MCGCVSVFDIPPSALFITEPTFPLHAAQIDADETIMRQVEEMCNGKANVELTFSEAGNAASALFESMTISGGGGGGGDSAAEESAPSQAHQVSD